jgi:hypothetical protein
MVVKKWLYNLFEILSLRRSMFFLANYSKGGTHAATPRGEALALISNAFWKRNGLELFTPIASNKNG